MKTVLFDLDGTLSNSKEGITKCVQFALDSFGIHEKNLDSLEVFIGPPLIDSFMKYYGFSEQKAKEATTKYRERYSVTGIYESSMYKGVKECLKVLKEQGYFISLASSKPEHYCRIILDYFGISELFDDVVGATTDGKIHNKEQVLEEFFSRWKDVKKENCCLIGDTVFDVDGANYVGIPCVGVSYGFGKSEDLINAGARFVVDDILELPNILNSIFN